MASQVLIDFASIGQSIAGAITTAVETAAAKLVEDSKEAAIQDVKANLTVREQVLSNANILYPIVESHGGGCCTHHLFGLPNLSVIVYGHCACVIAAVVKGDPQSLNKEIFIQDEEAETATEAVQYLLEVTMMMLQDEIGESIEGPHKDLFRFNGPGGYYAAR